MLIIVSPSKTMEICKHPIVHELTKPRFLKETQYIVSLVSKMTIDELKTFMAISDKIATQNYDRFQLFNKKNNQTQKSPAVLTFTGEVYTGLHAANWSNTHFDFAQQHLRILSGMYGSLLPKDEILPYRLEMGSRLKTTKGSNLYHYWKEIITSSLQTDLKKSSSNLLINLASGEYAKVVEFTKLKTRVITFDFYELRNGKKTFVSFSAKRARGLMATYIIKNQIMTFDQLKDFNEEGYLYDIESSTQDHLVFVKDVMFPASEKPKK